MGVAIFRRIGQSFNRTGTDAVALCPEPMFIPEKTKNMKKSFSLVLLMMASSAVQSATSLQLTFPQPTDGWLVAPAARPYSSPLEIAFQASESESSTALFFAGVMAENQCRSLAPSVPPVAVELPAGLIRGNGVSRYDVYRPNTPPNPSNGRLIKVVLPVAVKKGVKTPLLELCAYDAATNSTQRLPLKLSNGEPVKTVSVQQAEFSSARQTLSIRGAANPMGKNELLGSAVIVLNEAGQELGKGRVAAQNKFSLTLPLSENPGPVRVKVVNTVSNLKPVRSR